MREEDIGQNHKKLAQVVTACRSVTMHGTHPKARHFKGSHRVPVFLRPAAPLKATQGAQIKTSFWIILPVAGEEAEALAAEVQTLQAGPRMDAVAVLEAPDMHGSMGRATERAEAAVLQGHQTAATTKATLTKLEVTALGGEVVAQQQNLVL